ncbi:LLM class flavin-dependent oxidoreductase [Streptomyces sp. JJ38]|uniref:LLM class flavin-dependent oxidoreductase n=1 Tax=Streptomyces sp. JJ38 TaxID=2738128 RepID=UPI0027E1685C|nr:LLM class flavin-dependent oxidoreductase [Streptomyces sp. JJ38]
MRSSRREPGGAETALSVLVPFLPRRPEQLLPFAALVDWTPAVRLWQGQAMMVEPFQGFAAAAGTGFRVPTGVGVTLMPLRHPFEAAQQARSLALTTGRSVLTAFGPGGASFQTSLLGAPYASPLTASREYVTIVRGLLAGETVDVRGRYFSCHGALPPAPSPQVGIGLGVLRPGMARLAGEVADAAVTWLTPASYVRGTLRPALEEGARKADRPVPHLTAMVPLALHRPGRDAAELALASNAAHLAAPHYLDMLRRAGIEADTDDARLNAKRIVEGGAFLYGDLDELRSRIAEYHAAGVDEVVLNLTGLCQREGPKAALEDLKTLLTALAPV